MTIQEYEVCLSIRVSFVLEKDIINIYFLYDVKPSEIEEELIGDLSAEVISDFPESYTINCELIEIKYSEKIKSKGQVIFSRFEDDLKMI